jgi:hypothetical protein
VSDIIDAWCNHEDQLTIIHIPTEQVGNKMYSIKGSKGKAGPTF